MARKPGQAEIVFTSTKAFITQVGSHAFFHTHIPPPRRAALRMRWVDHALGVADLPPLTDFSLAETASAALQLHRHARQRQAGHLPLLSSDARQSLRRT